MKYGLFFLLLIIFSGGAPAVSIAADSSAVYDRIISAGTIKCGYATWPPYLVKDPNTGKLSGLSYDYVEQIGRVLNLKIDWVEEAGWGQYVQSLNNNRFDLMCSSDWAIGDRLKYSGITRPVMFSPLYVWVKAGSKITDVTALDDPKIKLAVIDGDTSQNVTRLNFPKAAQDSLPQEAEAAQILMDVTTGKADAAVMDSNIAEDFLKHNLGSIKRLGKGPVQVLPEVFVFKRGERDLKDLLDNAIMVIDNSGFTRDLIARYNKDEMAPLADYDSKASKGK